MIEQEDVSRRSFLGKAPVAGVMLGGRPVHRQELVDEAPNVPKELRIGALNVVAYLHFPAKWAAMINPRRESDEIAYTGMRITHCWDIDADKSKGFAREYGCVAVKEFDDMLGKVDAVISGGYYNHAHNHLLHEPYLKAGLPNLVNRPLANSVSKGQRLVELARRHKAPLLVPSALGHNNGVAQARQFVESSRVLGYHAAVSAEDYPTHGIHGLYMLSRVVADASNPIQAVSFRAKHWYSSPGVLTYEHIDKEGRPFFGTLHTGNFGSGSMHVHTDSEVHGRNFSLTMGRGTPYNTTEFWAPLMWVFEQMARTGKMPQSYDQILRKNRAYMAGWRSILTTEGSPVRLESVPPDWESPVALPNQPGDNNQAVWKRRFG